MTAPELRALIDEVEKATEGSEILDCKLFAFLDDREFMIQDNIWCGRSNKPPHDICVLGYVHLPRLMDRYTQSIDSAIAFGKRILGEDAQWSCEHLPPQHPYAYWAKGGCIIAAAHHPASAPLALVLAALRAYAAKEGS